MPKKATIEEIKDIAILDDFPRYTKLWGTNGTRIYIGKYQVNGFAGTSQVFIHRNSPPFIVIELENGWIFLNGSTEEETEGYYSFLLQR
jgi:hypothetical protein